MIGTPKRIGSFKKKKDKPVAQPLLLQIPNEKNNAYNRIVKPSTLYTNRAMGGVTVDRQMLRT